MHALHVDDISEHEACAPIKHASTPLALVRTEGPPARAAFFPDGERRRVNWPAAAIVILFHLALGSALLSMGIIDIRPGKRPPTIVKMLELPVDPPPATPPPPQDAKVEPIRSVQPEIVAPKPIVDAPQVQSPVVTAPEPPPVQTAIIAPKAPPAPVAAGPVQAGDLSSSMISASPPRYPIESRKKREQGTVVLLVLVGESGSVAELSVSRSSGFTRLDKAAMDAVRKWRWSPTIVGGTRAQVKGLVKIPFVLKD